MDEKESKRVINGIKKFKEKIKADKIVIFGSFARGEFGKHSDIDIILVSRKFKGKNFHSRFKGLWLKWDLDLPVDFIPYTPEEFDKLKKEVSIVSEALREGIVV